MSVAANNLSIYIHTHIYILVGQGCTVLVAPDMAVTILRVGCAETLSVPNKYSITRSSKELCSDAIERGFSCTKVCLKVHGSLMVTLYDQTTSPGYEN
jgi:hypothetical protein